MQNTEKQCIDEKKIIVVRFHLEERTTTVEEMIPNAFSKPCEYIRQTITFAMHWYDSTIEWRTLKLKKNYEKRSINEGKGNNTMQQKTKNKKTKKQKKNLISNQLKLVPLSNL